MFFAQCEIDGTKNIAKHGMKKFVQFRSEFIKTFDTAMPPQQLFPRHQKSFRRFLFFDVRFRKYGGKIRQIQ